MFLKFVVVFLCIIGLVVSNDEFVEYNERDGFAEVLSRGDSEHQMITLNTPINLFSEKYDHIYINTNGILTFTIEFDEFLNQPFPLEYPSIAPFYSNVDTNSGNESTGILFFRSKNPDVLNKASSLIRNSFQDHYNFQADIVYVATWENVGYFNSRTDKLNTFQAVIICTEVDTFVKFVYPENGIQWLRGEVGILGLPDIRAQAGFNSEDGRSFTLDGSGTEKIRFLSSSSNINTPGVWLYRIGTLDYSADIEEPNNPAIRVSNQTPYNCRDGLWKECSSDATCIDTREGFCCKCNEDFYGNGRSCISNKDPMRVIGSISGTINGQTLSKNIKAQSYVTLEDGRSYTAINPVNEDVESLLRLALPISGAVAWTFAKPADSSTSYGNGYQLTGGKFNNLANIRFPGSNDVLTINQTFEGLNSWDQLIVKIKVDGNIPHVVYDKKINLEDYVETYTTRGDNNVFSQSSGKFEFPGDNFSLDFNIDQNIKFDKCVYSDQLISDQPTFVRISKLTMDYFSRDKAVRTQYTAKISDSIMGELHPCEDRSSNCGYNTICQRRSDTEYDCLCKNGFEPERSNSTIQNCVDIDECALGNVCDTSANCRNFEGGFECVCPTGLYGNGFQCYEESPNEPPLPVVQIPYPIIHEQDPYLDHKYNSIPEENYQPNPYTQPDSSYRINPPLYPYEQDDFCYHCSADAACVNGRCECNAGFAGNGETCTIVCLSEEIYYNNQCVPLKSRAECPEDEENDICICPDGYEFDEDDDTCRFNRESSLSDCSTEHDCHANATCDWSEHFNVNICQCKPGFNGDGYTCTQLEDSCITNSEQCDPNASCLYDPSIQKYECHCKEGFEGDGTKCIQPNECHADYDCGINSYCDRGICQCNEGYERDSADFCVQNGRCGGAMCGENAICKTDHYHSIQYCECLEGFSGDPLVHCKSTPPPCNVVNNCGLYASCALSESRQYECVCDPGFNGDGYNCVEEITCRNTPSICDRNGVCVQSGSNFVCACNPGFLGNGTTCREIQTQEAGFFLIAQGPVITKVPFGKEIRAKPILVSTMTIGLDKDCVEGRIYYGDLLSRRIMSAKYDGSDTRAFITEDVKDVEGVAIDHISRRIYWTDSGKRTIEVASLEDPSLKTIVVHKNIINPRGIAIDAYFSKIYWSDWNRASPKIEMANLDGTERITLLEKPNVNLPNSLVVIPNTSELCYADAGNQQISCIDIFTKIIKTIATDASYPYGLAFTNDNFYWTDWLSKQIDVADRRGTRGQSLRFQFFGSHKMYSIVAVTDDCPVQRNACSVNNGGCTDNKICLINALAPSGMTCKCTQSSENCKMSTTSSEVLHNNYIY